MTTKTPVTSIDAATQVGLLSLTVADLERSLAYYTDAIGFELLEGDVSGAGRPGTDRPTARGSGSSATLGAGGLPLLQLVEQPGATPWPRGGESYTGLYHFAILMPSRADLGRWLRHWLDLGLEVPGQGDHRVSEALYLEDPDLHGIEIYRDRPREEWERPGGRVRMGTGPVDIEGLLQDAERSGEPWTGMPAGTRIGHIHLQIGDVEQAKTFYHDVLGFDITGEHPTALFMSAGGYHHHIGANVWHSKDKGPAPADSVRLQFFTIELPSEEARQAVIDRLDAAGIPRRQQGDVIAVEDPSNNTILLHIGAATAMWSSPAPPLLVSALASPCHTTSGRGLLRRPAELPIHNVGIMMPRGPAQEAPT